MFREEAFRLAHNLTDDGSGRKVLIHTFIGGLISQLSGAGFASGAAGAGLNEAIIGEIKKIKDPGTAQLVSAIAGKSKSDLYWNPKTGEVYSVPKKGGEPEHVADVEPRK